MTSRNVSPDRIISGVLAVTLIVTALPVSAQVTPPPLPAPVPTVVTPPPIAPAPVPVQIVPPAAPLPTLSETQATQLAELIARDSLAQGLRERAATTPPPVGDALVRAALDHAHAVHVGRLDTADFQRDWGIRPQVYDPLPGFTDAVRRDRLAAWVASLPPPYAGYDTLVAGLANYRKIAAAGGWAPLAVGTALKFGSSSAATGALRKRLAVEDTALPATGDKFDQALLDAVRRAQRRYGLNPAGQVGPQTITALNVPVEARIRQIMANMERWRWLPQQLEKDRVQVNIAAAVLTVFDGDQPIQSMKAVTGRPGDETPMLVSAIHSVVLNPPWNVPTSIATKELWPKERANPGYLRRNGFRVIDTGGGGKRLQQSSERSALGRYKFDFDNAFAVYLHDTPAQSGFSRFDRLASHGCVRLEKPADLAKLLMRTTPEWTPEAIDETVAAGKTVRAKMATPVAVYLLYWTAFANAAGQVSFRDDPYKWDGTLAGKIEARSAVQTLAAR
ncbi:L,D-transpeptidase family protein [Sphingomonas sp. SUN019]|uniref:L,D-transpeptidase family protein n=1 Tax=Sphingomonas sp. SUN019 TaxID=2937788 RepID=UPI002164B71C|nr:L,D-transpeptidase family protein [Sphingomonas sp. SUN019]UVO50309.1 L,D-transpeptidase family protein [Sphingomonas sp. SUN019]